MEQINDPKINERKITKLLRLMVATLAIIVIVFSLSIYALTTNFQKQNVMLEASMGQIEKLLSLNKTLLSQNEYLAERVKSLQSENKRLTETLTSTKKDINETNK